MPVNFGGFRPLFLLHVQFKNSFQWLLATFIFDL